MSHNSAIDVLCHYLLTPILSSIECYMCIYDPPTLDEWECYFILMKGIRVWRNFDGKCQRKCRSSLHSLKEDGSIDCEEWYLNGKLHRKNAPARIIYYNEDVVEMEIYYENGDHHRIDGPSVIDYYGDGKIHREEWYRQGKRHRVGDAAVVKYDEEGNILNEEWFVNGESHDDDGKPYGPMSLVENHI